MNTSQRYINSRISFITLRSTEYWLEQTETETRKTEDGATKSQTKIPKNINPIVELSNNNIAIVMKFNDLVADQVNNLAPYILSMPLLLTAITPTIYRIIRSTAINDNANPTQRKSTKTVTRIEVVSFIATYVIPCLLLFRKKTSDHSMGYDGIDAVYTAVLWRPLATFISSWPRILSFGTPRTKESQRTTIRRTQRLQHLVDGGPFGHGCGKIITVVVACSLWTLVRGTLPATIVNTFVNLPTSIFSIQKLTRISVGIYVAIVIAMLAAVSWIVTVVLSFWLQHTRSKGDSHAGLNKMLQPTYNRPLQNRECIQLAILALMNAICEECTSRGFWRNELERTAGCSKFQSNLLQGVIFGLWHYFGIPNGWAGVALTTVFGWIMGFLSDWTSITRASLDGSGLMSTGLLFPILTHSIIDYYIFTVLARQPSKP
jgi:Type II CAAX prenyl endopeptidase Rce1-like